MSEQLKCHFWFVLRMSYEIDALLQRYHPMSETSLQLGTLVCVMDVRQLKSCSSFVPLSFVLQGNLHYLRFSLLFHFLVWCFAVG
jgi:hypothetical protein